MGVTFCVAPTSLFGGFRPAGRGARNVLSSDGKNQRSPGDGSDERLRGAGAHSHLSPGPPIYGSGSLWVFGKFRRAKSRSVSLLFPDLRPLYHQNLQAFTLYRTPPGACLPVWCGRHRLPGCHGSARVGGVRTAANTLNFRLVGPKARGKKNARSCIRSRRTQMPNPQEGVPRKRGSRGRRL